MRFGRAVLIGSAASALLSAAPARANIAVVSRAAVDHAELALVRSDSGSIAWFRARAEGGPLALVIALEESDRREPALASWLVALEDTLSPRVIAAGDSCAPLVSSAAWPRGHASAPDVSLELTELDDVRTFLEQHDLPFPTELEQADAYSVELWSAREGPFDTRPLRLALGRTPSLAVGSSFPLIVDVVDRAPLWYGAAPPASVLPLRLDAESGTSDYVAAARRFVTGHGTAVVESAGWAPLFDWTIEPGKFSIPPLARRYYERAAAEVSSTEPLDCSEAITAERTATRPVDVGCESAPDLSAALARIAPSRATFSRFIVDSAAFDPAELVEGNEQAPRIVADETDESGCPVHVPSTPVPDEDENEDDDEGSSVPPPWYPEDDSEWVEESPPVYWGCGYSRHEDDSCSSDSSSSSDDSCSSDSSSSSDDSCSSDSSSSGDDSCSSDSSSSGDDSCSSDSSSSSDDSCSSDPDDPGYRGDTVCSMRRTHSRPRRVPLSLLTLGLASCALAVRRSVRRRTVGGAHHRHELPKIEAE